MTTSAEHPFLNQEHDLTPVLGDFITKGDEMAANLVNALDGIAASIGDVPDFGAGLTQTGIDGITVTLPTAPTASSEILPTIGTDPSDAAWIACINATKAIIEYREANPTGLTAAVEAAIYSRANNRETAKQAESYSNFAAMLASNGFSVNSRQSASAFIHFETEKSKALSTLNLEILINQANLEQTNRQKNLEAYLTLVERYKGLYDSQEDVMIKRVNLGVDIVNLALAMKNQEIAIYETTGKMFFAESELAIKKVDSVNAANLNLNNNILKQMEVILAYKNNAIEANKAMGALAAQTMAAAYNAVSVSISQGESKHWGWSESP